MGRSAAALYRPFAAYLLTEQDVTAQSILDYAPANPWLAATFLLLLYAVKSLSVVFPLIVLNIAGGFLFQPLTAILVNTLGVLIELTIPYWVGRVSRTDSAGKLMKKYPKLAETVSFQHGNALFLSFSVLLTITISVISFLAYYFGCGKRNGRRSVM